MVAVKAHQAQEFVGALAPSIRAVLFYGTDSGLIAERARELAGRLAARASPPGEILRMDDESLAEDPGRLAVELSTRPMFGGANVIRAAAGRRVDADAVRPLLDGPPLEGFLIVEAQNLAPSAPLRKLFESSGRAAAIPCYADEARDLSALLDGVLGEAGLAIDADARQSVLARLGADRALSRSELDKLVLYAHGRERISLEDVEEIVGDASEATLDRVVLAAGAKRLGDAVAALDRALAAGETAHGVIAALQRHFLRLHRVRAGLDAGQPQEQALRVLRPPLFFKQQAEFVAQCRAWTLASLTEAVSAIAEAARRARTTGEADALVAERLVMRLSVPAPAKA